MAELTLKETETVQRALGIIEGVACALRYDKRYEAADGMLITAVEMIETALSGGADNG